MARPPIHPLSRRRLLQLGAGGLLVPAGLGLVGGRGALAEVVPGDRRFLFLFCSGGWDPTECLAPMLGSVVENTDDAEEAEANGLSFITGESRPAVAPFFETWGSRCALVHGMEARSVAHDVCLRLMLTGTTLPQSDDWPSILASGSERDLLLPMLHITGPTYTGDLASEVVRVGASGQLAELLSGDALGYSTQPVVPLPHEARDLADALVQKRIQDSVETASRGRRRELAELTELSDHRLVELLELGEGLDLTGGEDFVGQCAVLAELFEAGLARTGMVEFYGTLGLSWDTHAAHHLQGTHFNTLLEGIDLVLADLDSRPGSEVGSTLLDETTVVVLSEMGRYPTLNSRGGKEHWTYTSAMLLGSGIRGGTTVGGYDRESFLGLRVDTETGEARDDGEALLPGHLGATLLELAGMDSSEWTEHEAPISAVLDT